MRLAITKTTPTWKRKALPTTTKICGFTFPVCSSSSTSNVVFAVVVGVSFVDYYYLKTAAHFAGRTLLLTRSYARSLSHASARVAARASQQATKILVRTLLPTILSHILTHPLLTTLCLSHNVAHRRRHQQQHQLKTTRAATTTATACCRLWSRNEHINSRNCDYFGFIKRQVSKPNQTLLICMHVRVCMNIWVNVSVCVCTCVYLFNVACYKSQKTAPRRLTFRCCAWKRDSWLRAAERERARE